MHIAAYYEFFIQAKIISGNKAMEQLPVELDSYNSRKPFAIMSKKIAKSASGKKFIKALYDSNVIIGAMYDNVPDYASISMIKELAVLFRNRGCDSIIVIGDGAVMDVGRGVNILVSQKDDDLLKYAGKNILKKSLKPLIYIPTSTSTGYESSNLAIIEAREFSSDFLYPDIICIDPRITVKNCSQCVAESAMVALTHSIEIFAVPVINPVTDSYALASIQYIYENLEKAVKRSGNKEARLAIANAEVMAGIAFSNSTAGMAHSLGVAMADSTGLSQGVCMGILLPYCLEFMLYKKNTIRDILLFAIAGHDVYSETPEDERIQKSFNMLHRFHQNFKKLLPQTFEQVNVPEYKMTEAALRAAGSNKKLMIDDCLIVLEHAYHGKPI